MSDKKEIENQLLALTREFLRELQAERALQAITLDASLESELGIDSLGKVELFHRIENEFVMRIPESFLAKANTLRDIAEYIQESHPLSSTIITPREMTPALESTTLNLSAAATFLEVIAIRAAEEPNRPHVYLQDENGNEKIIRYGQLYEKALQVAHSLQQRGIRQGETIAIMLPTSEEFFYVFCGTLLAGAVPVPIYPPFRADRIEEYAKREAKILRNAEVRILVTFSSAELLSKILRSFIPSLTAVVTMKDLSETSTTVSDVNVTAKDTMLIQYTSGSTGDPKGVQLTHASFLANIQAMGQSVPIYPTDVVVSWLPLYHDMGLMNWLGSLYLGIPVTIMSPLTFLTRPEKWLWTIHYHRATLSGGPNFAYELCVKKINSKNLTGLDLSSWRYAFTGAEAVNPRTLERFYKKFSAYGFKKASIAPVYGLAESTVGLTFPPEQRELLVEKIDRDSFQKDGKAILAENGNDKNVLEVAACGQPLPQHEIRVVSDAGAELPERCVGNIQFRGPSSMSGYFNNPEATRKIYHQGWWDTGDLGYIANQDLFITGRKKDVIIKAGRNYFPEEIEEITSQIPDIRKGCVVAFGVSDANTGTERLIVVAETYVQNAKRQHQIRNAIIEKLSVHLGIPPDQVLLVPPKTVLKTSSGKLQRSATKAAFLQNKLKYKMPAKLQFTKLALLSAWETCLRCVRLTGKLIYTAYVFIWLVLTMPLVLLAMLLTPRAGAARIARVWARTMLRCAFCPVVVTGKEHCKKHKPVIYVANHASYVDSLLLLGILPAGVVFVAKKEVLQMPVVRFFVRKLNFLTVDRLDFSKSLEDSKQLELVAAQKKSLIIFPEGTFTYATGLRPFKLGAFNLAVKADLPVCPIALKGTRDIFRDDKFVLRPGKINVHIGKWIAPKENSWNEVIRLHSLARAEIAKYCGEPAIDIISAGPETVR